MSNATMMVSALSAKHWYSLGYSDYPNFEYVKNVKEVSGVRTQAALIANIDERTKTVRFCPRHKKAFSYDDCRAMLYMENEFMEIARYYGYQKVGLK